MVVVADVVVVAVVDARGSDHWCIVRRNVRSDRCQKSFEHNKSWGEREHNWRGGTAG